MTKQIERLRYFDREYLRSYDFTDEQSYHVEMRRRLNHRLHLHGIVYGLQLVQDQDSVPPDAIFFSIAPGMALDQLGREIFVPAPYSLSPENILNRPDLVTGDNELWLCYQEMPTGLPAAGYRDCHATDQQTRYEESFQVMLRPVNGKAGVGDCYGIRLGIVKLDNSDGWKVTDVQNKGRTYVGIRTQRVIPADEEADPFDIAAQNVKLPDRLPLLGYVDVLPGMVERSNLIVEKNMVIGDDFVLDPTVNKNLPKNIPGSGNLKVTNDLFLAGDFYGFLGGDWYKLKDYIQTLMPNVVVGTPPLSIVIPQTANTSDTVHVSVSTTLANVSKTQVFLSIIETDWRDASDLQNWPGKGPLTVAISVAALSNTGPNTYDLAIQWTVGPSAKISGVDSLPITKLIVNYMVVFTP